MKPIYKDSHAHKDEMARQHIRIGVFIPSPSATQLLDTACVDIFAMMSHQYLQGNPPPRT